MSTVYNYFDEHGYYTHALPHEGVVYSESCTDVALPEQPWPTGKWPMFSKVLGAWTVVDDPAHIEGMADAEHEHHGSGNEGSAVAKSEAELMHERLEELDEMSIRPMRSLFHDGGTREDVSMIHSIEKEYRYIKSKLEAMPQA